MCIKDKLCDLKALQLERSLDARMAISKHGAPMKAYSMHRSCSTPLWKVVLITLSVMVALAMVCHLCKRSHCDED